MITYSLLTLWVACPFLRHEAIRVCLQHRIVVWRKIINGISVLSKFPIRIAARHVIANLHRNFHPIDDSLTVGILRAALVAIHHHEPRHVDTVLLELRRFHCRNHTVIVVLCMNIKAYCQTYNQKVFVHWNIQLTLSTKPC